MELSLERAQLHVQEWIQKCSPGDWVQSHHSIHFWVVNQFSRLGDIFAKTQLTLFSKSKQVYIPYNREKHLWSTALCVSCEKEGGKSYNVLYRLAKLPLQRDILTKTRLSLSSEKVNITINRCFRVFIENNGKSCAMLNKCDTNST